MGPFRLRRSERIRRLNTFGRRTDEIISISSNSSRASPTPSPLDEVPQPSSIASTSSVIEHASPAIPTAGWQVSHRNDTSMRLTALRDEQQVRISDWLARVDNMSEASTISNVTYNHRVFEVEVDVVDNNFIEFQRFEDDRFSEEYEPDGDDSVNDELVVESALPMTFVSWLNTLTDQPNGIDCSICNLALVHKEFRVISTECGHVFHDLCLEEHMRNSNKCPKCRDSIDASYNQQIFF